MCTCRACEPARCCQEKSEAEDTGNCPMDSYNFGANDKCGISIESCQSRCFEHRWRADVQKGCEASRPPQCCAPSASPT